MFLYFALHSKKKQKTRLKAIPGHPYGHHTNVSFQFHVYISTNVPANNNIIRQRAVYIFLFIYIFIPPRQRALPDTSSLLPLPLGTGGQGKWRRNVHGLLSEPKLRGRRGAGCLQQPAAVALPGRGHALQEQFSQAAVTSPTSSLCGRQCHGQRFQVPFLYLKLYFGLQDKLVKLVLLKWH